MIASIDWDNKASKITNLMKEKMVIIYLIYIARWPKKWETIGPCTEEMISSKLVIKDSTSGITQLTNASVTEGPAKDLSNVNV